MKPCLACAARWRRLRANALCFEAARYLAAQVLPTRLLDEAAGLLAEANLLDGGRCDA